MILETPDGFIDTHNPHFYTPSLLKSIECKHHYTITKYSFVMKASEFFENNLLDYDLNFEKTKIECCKCGLTNTIFRHIF
jgi:hypothetical protein